MKKQIIYVLNHRTGNSPVIEENCEVNFRSLSQQQPGIYVNKIGSSVN